MADMEDRPLASTGTERDDTTNDEWRSKPLFTKFRTWSTFWICGLADYGGYIVMLTAAFDILDINSAHDKVDGCLITKYSQPPYHLFCHTVGTGAVLVADIIPSISAKFLVSFNIHRLSYNLWVMAMALFGSCGFIIVGLGGSYNLKWLIIVGVCATSIGSGMGEAVFLSYSSHFDRSCFSAWSSGTGFAGILGGVLYSSMTQAGLSTSNTMFAMLLFPLLQVLSFYGWLVKPEAVSGWRRPAQQLSGEYKPLVQNGPEKTTNPHQDHQGASTISRLSFTAKLKSIKPLLKYIIPLMSIFVAEYYINQALIELLYFPASCSTLKISEQYRWLITIYQIGNFFARSSLGFFRWKHIWILPILQVANLAILQSQVILHYMPNSGGLWIVFVIVFWEGCLGGLAYTNAFDQVANEVTKDRLEFSMSMASTGDGMGIMISAFLTIFLHNKLCEMNITWS